MSTLMDAFQLSNELLSVEDKKIINEQMIDIANKMSAKDS